MAHRWITKLASHPRYREWWEVAPLAVLGSGLAFSYCVEREDPPRSTVVKTILGGTIGGALAPISGTVYLGILGYGVFLVFLDEGRRMGMLPRTSASNSVEIAEDPPK